MVKRIGISVDARRLEKLAASRNQCRNPIALLGMTIDLGQ